MSAVDPSVLEHRIATALLADWRAEHPHATQLALASAGVGALRAARIALRVINESEQRSAA